jgi:DivIVA domain-containing protein
MTWFFAVLAVLALGAIAMVASGYGAPMAPAYDDRPDVTVPADGDVTGDDLRRIRFTTAVRGYRMAEVDALLDRLAGQLEEAERRAGTGTDASADAGTGTGGDTGGDTDADTGPDDGPDQRN